MSDFLNDYEDWKKRKNGNESTTVSSSDDDFTNAYERYKAGKASEEIYSRTNELIKNIGALIDTHYARYKDGNDAWRSDSLDYYNSVNESVNAFNTEADSIMALLNKYGSYYDDDFKNSVTNALSPTSKNREFYTSVIDDSKKDYEFWSQWESEEEYKDAMKANEEYQRNMDYDLEAGKARIDDLKADIARYEAAETSQDKMAISYEIAQKWGNIGSSLLASSEKDSEEGQDLSSLPPDVAAALAEYRKSHGEETPYYMPKPPPEYKSFDFYKYLKGLEDEYSAAKATQDAYAASLEAEKLKEEYLAYNEVAGQEELDKLKEIVSDIPEKPGNGNTLRGTQTYREYQDAVDEFINKYDMTPAEAKALLAEKTKYHNAALHAKRLQELEKGADKISLSGDEFETYELPNTIITQKTLATGKINRIAYGNFSMYGNTTGTGEPIEWATDHDDRAEDACYMYKDEKRIYNSYFFSGDYESAEEYYRLIKPELEQRKNSKYMQDLYDNASRFPFLSSAVSVGTSLGSSIEFLFDAAKYGIDYIKDPYSAEMDENTLAQATATIRGAVSDKVNWQIGNWDAFDFLYNTLMSGVDSFVASFIPGGGVVLGLSAAAQGVNDALERGMSSEQAFWSGVAQGVFEGLFESVSIGKFKGLQEAVVKGGKDIAMNIVKSMLVNASEETATEIANILYDTLVNGEFSNYAALVQEQLDRGADEEEAKAAAMKTLGLSVLESGASGALMGFGFGFGGSMISKRKTARVKVLAAETKLRNMGVKEDAVNTIAPILAAEKGISASQARKILNNTDALTFLSKVSGKNLTADSSVSDIRSAVKGYLAKATNAPKKTAKKVDRAIRAINAVNTNAANTNAANTNAGSSASVRSDVLAKLSAKLGNEESATYAGTIQALLDGEVVSDRDITAVLQNEHARNVLNGFIKNADFSESTTANEVRAAAVAEDHSRRGQALSFGSILNIGENGLKGLISVANNSTEEVSKLAKAYNAVYKAGKQGEAFTNDLSDGVLTPVQRKMAYNYGEMDRLVEASKNKKSSGEVLQKDGESGKIESSEPSTRIANIEGEGTGKKKPRTKEERQEAIKKIIETEYKRLRLLSPERQKYLSDKYDEYRGIIEQLEVGDKLINDNGDIVGEVINISDGRIFIVGESGFTESILPDSFTDDGVIGMLDVGDGHFEKPDGTWIGKNDLSKEIVGDGNPIYETLENRKPIEPIDYEELKRIRAQSVKEFELSEKQASSLNYYVMSLAYMINIKLNSGNITDSDRSYIDNLIEALKKFPMFEGRTYRNLKFKNEQDYNAFLEENSGGNTVPLKAFTSTSKDPNGYPLFGKYVVHMVFDGVSGRDIADTYGIPRQQEVLYLPGVKYRVESVSIANDGNPIIFVKEIVTNEAQLDNGNFGIGGAELNRDARGNGTVHQEQGNDNVRIHGDGRGAENAGAGRKKVLDADTRSEEQETQAEVDKSDSTAQTSDGTITLKTGEKVTPVKEMTKEQSKVVDAGKRIGVDVVIADVKKGKKNIDGLWDGKTLYINPNPNSGNPMFTLLKHELTHFTQLSRKYNRFLSSVIDSKEFARWLKDKGFNGSMEYIEKIISDYKKVGKDWNNAEGRIKAQQEMIANFVGEVLFAGDGSLERFVNELSPDHKRTFKELVRDFINWLKQKLGKTDEIAMLEKKYAELFRDAKKVAANGNIENTESSYSISPDLDRELDMVLNGKFDASKNEVYLGETSNFMTDVIGAEALSLYMPTSKVYSALVSEEEYNKKPYYSKQDNYHGIGKEDFIEILKKSEEPILAFAAAPDDDGNKRQNRIVLVTDKQITDAKSGKRGYAVVVEEVESLSRRNGKVIKANKAVTVYARSQLEQDVINAIIDSRILHSTKKGEHLFAGRRGFNPQASIRKDVLKKNIAYFWANVKWEKQKSKNFSSEKSDLPSEFRLALEKAGYIDQDGHIKYMQESDDSSQDKANFVDEKNGKDSDYFYTPASEESSTREILTNMMETSAESEREKNLLVKYKGHLARIEEYKAEIAGLEAKRQSADKAHKNLFTSKITSLENRIAESEKWLSKLEETPTIKRLVEKELKVRGDMAEKSADKSEETSYSYTPAKKSKKGWGNGSDYLIKHFTGKINFDYAEMYISDEELAVISHSVKTGWGALSKSKAFGRVFTSDAYYVFTFEPNGSITIFDIYDTDSDNDIIDFVETEFNNERIRQGKIKTVDGWLDIIRDGQRRRLDSDDGNDSQTGRTGAVDGLDGGSPESNTGGNRQTGTKAYQGNDIDDSQLSYTPKSEGTIDELVSQFEDGRITKDELVEALANKKPNDDPISLANTTEEDFNTTPTVKRKTGENNVDGERETIISRGASKLFSEEFKDEAKADAFIMKYKTIKNKDALRKAADELDAEGEQGVLKWMKINVEKGVSLTDVIKGYILLERYKLNGDIESQVTVAQKLSEMGTLGGQIVQSFTILSRFTPEGMLLYAQRTMDEVRKRMIETQSDAWLKKHADSLNLTDADIEYIYNRTILASGMVEGRDNQIILAEIAARLQKKIPPAKGQSIKALQRISMLLNPKTIIRNVLGNATIAPAHWLSDWIGMPLDAVLAIKTGQRTKGIKTDIKADSEASWKGFKYAIEDWLKDINTQEDLDRFEIDKRGGKSFYEGGRLAPVARMLNAMDRLTSFTLAAGDRPFYEYWFSRSLNSQMAANKVTTPTPEMIEIATQEALERTWQDNNNVTAMVSKIKGALNTLSVGGYGLGDVFIKFTKTPANLAKAIYDFSPAGFATVAKDAVKFNQAVKSGKGVAMAQRNLVKSFGNAAAGTLMYLLAYALFKAGRLTGGSDEDKDVAAFEKWVQGIPAYSVKLFGKWFSYEWMQPLGSVAAIVSDYMEAKDTEGDDKLQPVITALKSGGAVLYNQSFLRSLQALFTADNPVEGFIEAVLDDPTSFIPQLASQFASIGDEVRRTTYDASSPIKSLINSIKYKIPGLRNTLTEDVDVFGRTVPNSQSSIGEAFFNPANTYVDTSDAVTDHVYGLYKELGNKAMIPAKAPYKITIDGKSISLSAEERADYQRIMGGVSYNIISQLLESELYNSYTPDEQETVISAVYSYAKKLAQANYPADYTFDMAKKDNPYLTRSEYDAMTDEDKQEAYRKGVMSEYTDILNTDEDGVIAYFELKGIRTAALHATMEYNGEKTRELIEKAVEKSSLYGAEGSDVKSLIRTTMTTYWKLQYKVASYENNREEMDRIEQVLIDTELYGNSRVTRKTLKEWLEEEQE